jgi:itaconate CoA-transferase
VGATLDITMFESLGEWMGFPAYFTAYGGTPPPRSGAYHATIVPYGPFAAGDGKTVFLSIQNEREFARFCDQVLGEAALAKDPRFASSPARVRNRDAMHAEIGRVFGALTATQVEQRLEAAGIANARLNTLQEFWHHPQLAARNRWREVGTSAGPVRAPLPPFNLSEFEPRMDEVPALGAHSRKVLAELGYAEGEIERLAAEGTISSS